MIPFHAFTQTWFDKENVGNWKFNHILAGYLQKKIWNEKIFWIEGTSNSLFLKRNVVFCQLENSRNNNAVQVREKKALFENLETLFSSETLWMTPRKKVSCILYLKKSKSLVWESYGLIMSWCFLSLSLQTIYTIFPIVAIVKLLASH